MNIQVYNDDLKHQYEYLLNESSVSVFNHSLKYRSFLKAIFPDSDDCYLCCIENEKIIGCLPLFFKRSLRPNCKFITFFGSHGGIIYSKEFTHQHCSSLFRTLEALLPQDDLFSCTLIESPFESQHSLYHLFSADLADKRIGQITPLPVNNSSDSASEQLLSLYHTKTRNMVRKGLKSGFSFRMTDLYILLDRCTLFTNQI